MVVKFDTMEGDMRRETISREHENVKISGNLYVKLDNIHKFAN